MQPRIHLVEEVARMWGYERIHRTVPAGAGRRSAGLSRVQRERRKVRSHLSAWGYDEAWTTTFLAPGDLERAGLEPEAVEVENPLDRSESILRTSLVPGLLKAARFNADRQIEQVALFEIGTVFALPSGELTVPDEAEHLGVIVAAGPAERGDDKVASEAVVRTWTWLAEALRLAGWTMEPGGSRGWHQGRSARLIGSHGDIGTVGELAPEVVEGYGLSGRVAMLSVSLDSVYAEPRRDLRSREVEPVPGV